MQDVVALKQQVNRIMLELNAVQGQLAANQSPTLSSPDTSFHPIPPVTPPSAVNQLRNGEFGHSNDTWFAPPPGAPTSDAGKECAWWFSNSIPAAGQLLDFAISPATPDNDTLKAYGDFGGVHPFYDPTKCDWDRNSGEARLTGTASLDAPLPTNRLVTPNRAVEYFGALIARRNSTIIIPDDCHIYAGLWDNTNSAPRPDWITGTAFPLTGEVRGTPAAVTERRYKVFAFTDRGYTYLSAELTVLNAPASFNGNVDVYLTWRLIPGILQYAVYRHDVVEGKYRLLRDSLIGSVYADNGVVLVDDVGGYPTPTDLLPKAYVATRENDLENVPVDGAPWGILTLNIPIPSDYDQGQTTGEQVLRVGMTTPLDRQMEDVVVTGGNPTITSATAEFTALDVGRTVILTKANDTLTTTVASVGSPTAADLTVAPSWNATDATLFIEEGGDHGILLDAAHMSYLSGAAFAPYPDDMNRLENGGQDPIAAPSSSSQGGSGGGGDPNPGGGGIGCVTWDCPITVWSGNTLETLMWKAIAIGESLFSGDIRANWVRSKPTARTLDLCLTRIKAHWLFDIEVPSSPGHRLITNNIDERGKAVENLRIGDSTLITIDGHVSRNAIREIVRTGTAADVGSFILGPGHVYCAGRIRYRSRWHGWIAAIMKRCGWREPVVGALSHNTKPVEGDRV